MHRKLKKAIAIIRKFGRVNAKPTEEETICYLYEQTQKSIGSVYVNKAATKAMRQQDWPKDVAYDSESGMLILISNHAGEVTEVIGESTETAELKETVEYPEPTEPTETAEQTEPTETKRKRKTEKTDELDFLS